MPVHKGIKMTIVSQLEFHVHPEFPHPESSQFTNRSPNVRGIVDAHLGSSQSPPPKGSKADRLLGRQSAVSVYIPSVPGARFWLRYSIDDEAAQESPWYFFKLSMNGSQVASWGTNSKTAGSEQVMRGLFNPSSKWNYRHEGTTFKCMGTETRPFFFAKEDEARSAATDGGMIQIQVFRAAGRKRKMPEPADYKPQERYGIVMPSSGLIDNPEDAKFYDWRLTDPKDSPLSVFRFHYRSWDSLETLQLIPSTYPRKLLPSSASILSFHGLSRELQERLRESESDGETLDIDATTDDRSSIASNLSDTPWLTPVFDNNSREVLDEYGIQNAYHVPESAPLYPNRVESPIGDKLASAIVDKPTSPDNGQWKEYLDRPLPQVPTRRSSLKHLRRHSRKLSSTSTTPSITSSLRSYADRDTLSPEPVVRTAELALLTQHSSPTPNKQDSAASESDYSPEKYLVSPDKNNNDPSDSPSKSGKRGFLSRNFRRSASRKNKITYDNPGPINRPGATPPPILLPNVTVRKTRNSPPKTPLKNKKNVSSFAAEVDELSSTLMNTTPTMSEAEWMCRTPSPLKKTVGLGMGENKSPASVPVKKRANRGFERENGSGQLLNMMMGVGENRSPASMPAPVSEVKKNKNGGFEREGGSGQLLDMVMDENRRGNWGSDSVKGSDGKSSLRKKVVGWYSKDKGGGSVDDGGEMKRVFGDKEIRTGMGEMGGNWI